MKGLSVGYIEGFSKERFHSWKNKATLIEANERSESKYLDCFIFSWIAFNHYYASWWFNHHRKDKEKFYDEAAWNECIRENGLIEKMFLDIKSQDNIRLRLPVEGGRRNDHPVPATKHSAEYACDDLSLLEFLQICYRIRNNLIHGTKDIKKERDQECTKFAYKNLILLLNELENTL
jgi:hypothetical protein